MYLGFLNPVQNPLKRIASLLSVTYTMPISRLRNDTVDKAMHEYAPDVDVALGEAERMKNGMADAFVVPFWDETSRKRICFNSTVRTAGTWCTRKTACWITSKIDEDVRYYTDGAITRKGTDGKWTGRRVPVRVCPVIWFRLNPYSTPYGVSTRSRT